MGETEEKFVHPFFSKKPHLPKWRDAPWMLFVLGIAWGVQYTPVGNMEISDGRAGFLIIALALGMVAGAWVILWVTHKIFPFRGD